MSSETFRCSIQESSTNLFNFVIKLRFTIEINCSQEQGGKKWWVRTISTFQYSYGKAIKKKRCLLSNVASSLQKHSQMIFHNILKSVSFTLQSYSHRSIISQKVNHSELLSPTHNSAENCPLKSCGNCWRYCGCNPLIYFDPLFAFRVLHMLIACSSTAFMNKCDWYFSIRSDKNAPHKTTIGEIH